MSSMAGNVEPVTPLPVRPVTRTVFTQRWSHLTFLHWAVPPEQVAPLLPPGVMPDTHQDVSYVGLVPFVMGDIGVWGSPGIPYFGDFLETNVRLYSVDRLGRRGVVFVSLEASRLATVLAARTGPGLPYMWSRMRMERRGERIAYASRRRWPGPRGTSSLVRIRVGGPVEAGDLEHFLTARWGLHLTDRNGRTRYWPNVHQRWPLRRASLEHLDDDLLAAAGFGDLAAREPDSVLYSPGLGVTFGPRLPALE
jgi:uncharacterized protein YqjF (DUF2071 family)